MYFETGLGQAFKPRPKVQTKPRPKAKAKPRSKVPEDRFIEVYAYWDLKVPFRKDFGAFRQKVAEAIGRHVATNEKKTIDGLLTREQKALKAIHAYYSAKPESDFVTVRANLRFRKNNHTDFDWLSIEAGPLSQ